MLSQAPPGQAQLKAKICLVGDRGVGKTSLIRRFVLSMYDDHYLRTVGTRVSKKMMWIVFPGTGARIEVDLMIWDIMGEVEFRGMLSDTYFAGAQGLLAVCDITRRDTLEGVFSWVEFADAVASNPALVIVANKVDLSGQAQFDEGELKEVADAFGCAHIRTSAKTGENVQVAFQVLTRSIFENLQRSRPGSAPVESRRRGLGRGV